MLPIWLAGKRAGHNECPVCPVYPVRRPVGPFINLDGDRVQAAPSPAVLPQTGRSPCAGLALVIVACRCYISQGRVSCAVWVTGGRRCCGTRHLSLLPHWPGGQSGGLLAWPGSKFGLSYHMAMFAQRVHCTNIARVATPTPPCGPPSVFVLEMSAFQVSKNLNSTFRRLMNIISFLGGIVCGSGYSYLGMCKRVEIPFWTRVVLGKNKKKIKLYFGLLVN